MNEKNSECSLYIHHSEYNLSLRLIYSILQLSASFVREKISPVWKRYCSTFFYTTQNVCLVVIAISANTYICFLVLTHINVLNDIIPFG